MSTPYRVIINVSTCMIYDASRAERIPVAIGTTTTYK